jgi:hypothetical protein
MAAPSLYRATAAITIRTTPEAAFDAWLDPRQAVPFLQKLGTNDAGRNHRSRRRN